MLSFVISWQDIVSTILLVARYEVRIVYRSHRLVISHTSFKLKLQIEVEDLGPFHSHC